MQVSTKNMQHFRASVWVNKLIWAQVAQLGQRKENPWTNHRRVVGWFGIFFIGGNWPHEWTEFKIARKGSLCTCQGPRQEAASSRSTSKEQYTPHTFPQWKRLHLLYRRRCMVGFQSVLMQSSTTSTLVLVERFKSLPVLTFYSSLKDENFPHTWGV